MSEETLVKLREIIADKMDVDPSTVTPEKRFTDLGADSLDLYEMVYEVESTFGISVPEEKTADLETVGDVISFIEENS